ncbi:hypothetical protein [Streptomyces lavendulae]|uniref:hypothetical protein n=1 Tax=Streptomyces lavendulae TaxID=1914 RepID=UPI0024A4F60D|nr:hypothetical protein [Streptomyces lavendulae]GLX23241.1 hypothetical protein Slala01_68850 [Streptomyces lavendulae subsp. lavendulae]GLX30704.1 hypothetical protein Slala02_65240 [Streptomyces lavendulae subsp. lavendulae]
MHSSPHTRLRRTLRTAAALLPLAALAACGGGKHSTPAAVGPPPTARFSENGVTVTLSVSGWQPAQGTGTLTAVFAPETPGFHLYSTALPPAGVEGVGRPTAVAVTGTLAADGPLTAAQTERTVRLPGVDTPVPVYPDGPVTTTLPVRASGSGSATVLIGYASCSTRDGCTIPVSGHPVRLRVTAGGPAFVTP